MSYCYWLSSIGSGCWSLWLVVIVVVCLPMGLLIMGIIIDGDLLFYCSLLVIDQGHGGVC